MDRQGGDLRLLAGATVVSVTFALLFSLLDGIDRELSGVLVAAVILTVIVTLALGASAFLSHRDAMPSLTRLMACGALGVTVFDHAGWAILMFGVLALIYAAIWDCYYLGDGLNGTGSRARS